MSENQAVSSWVWSKVFPVDPYKAEEKGIKEEERLIKAMLKGKISPKRARNRRSKIRPKAIKSPKLKGRLRALDKKRDLANRQWFGRKLERVAGWLGVADLPIRFVAVNLQLDSDLSVGQRVIRATGRTLASKGKAIAVSLLIASMITVLL